MCVAVGGSCQTAPSPLPISPPSSQNPSHPAPARPQATQDGLTNALDRVQNALQQITQAPALVSLVVSTPQGGKAEKLQIAQSVLQKAQDAMTSALDSLQAEAENVRSKIRGAMLPKKPAGVDTATLLDRKADVQALIVATAKGPTSTDIVLAAARVLKDAIARNDPDGQLTAYVVAGGPLDLWYQAHSVNTTELNLRIAEAMGSVDPNGPAAGAGLAALLGGGRNTLAGYIDVARVIATNEMQAARDALQKASYTVIDAPWAPYNGPRP